MTRARKVHRFGFEGQGRKRRGRSLFVSLNKRLRSRAACGVFLYGQAAGVIDLVFATFPTERRCWACESKYRGLIGRPEHAQLWITTVEVLCLELARLGDAMGEIR